MKPNLTPAVNARYGAPLGRPDAGGIPDEPRKLYLARVYLDSQGYDDGGAYWGIGAPLYAAFDDNQDFRRYFRARNREAAKTAIRAEYPEALFYRS